MGTDEAPAPTPTPEAVTPPAVSVQLPTTIRKPIDYPSLSGISNMEIQNRIDAGLANLKENEKGAVVAYIDTNGVGRLSVFGKSGEHWSYVATATHGPDEKTWGGEVEVRYSW